MNHFCSAPYIYTLEITAACNARCPGCGNVFGRSNLCITSDQCRIILENIRDWVEMIRLTGGEPTLSPHFGDILGLLDSLNKPIVVFTNGFWNSPETVIANLKACRNLDGILISMHGHSSESYRAFTGGDHFEQVMNSIRQASKAGVTVNTNLILTHQNIHHLKEAVSLALDAGAQVVAFSRYYGTPIAGVTDLTPDQYRLAVHQVQEFRQLGLSVKFNNNIPLCLGGELTQACPASDTHCTIGPDCQVRVCNHSSYTVGSILNTPIQVLWASEAIQLWRQGTPEPCRTCQMLDYCRGGCRANAQANQSEMDPLACTPFTEQAPLPPIQHRLYAEARPRIHFTVREESFGFVLINRSQIFKIAHEGRPLLETLQRERITLAEIENRFGQAALNFIGLLYDRRLVELEMPQG